MTPTEINPFAFPNAVAVDGSQCLNYSSASGMTLRDYFAIRAPEPSAEEIHAAEAMDRDTWPRRSRLAIIAAYRYAYADALLRERSRPCC